MKLEDGWKMISGGTLFLIFAVISAIAVFLVQESRPRSFRFYFWEVSRLFLAVFLAVFLTGFMSGRS